MYRRIQADRQSRGFYRAPKMGYTYNSLNNGQNPLDHGLQHADADDAEIEIPSRRRDLVNGERSR